MTLSALPPAAVAAARAPETYTLTIRHLDRQGTATDAYLTHVTGVSGPGASEEVSPHDASGTVTVRLPKGRYLLDSTLSGPEEGSGTDWIVQPRLDLDRDTTVTVDARTTAPVDVRPQDPDARFLSRLGVVEVTHDGTTRSANVMAGPDLRVAHLGPDAEPDSVKEWFDTYWEGGTNDYALGYSFTSARALTGLVRHPSAASLATVEIRRAAPEGGTGNAFVSVQPSAGPTVGLVQPLRPLGTATVLVTPSGAGGTSSTRALPRPGRRPTGTPRTGSRCARAPPPPTPSTTRSSAPPSPPRPAPVRRASVTAPASPSTSRCSPTARATRRAHRASAPPPPRSTATGSSSALRRGAPGRAAFTTTPGAASYRLTATATRGDGTAPGGRVTAAWTFTSAATTRPTALPLSTVRFAPALGLDGTAPAGDRVHVPVTVQGAAAGSGVRSLTVSVSTDGGATWTRVPVADGRAAFRNPAAGRSVSLRAELTDTKGNTLTQTLTDAYRTR